MNYIFFSINELNKVDFSQVTQSPNTLVFSFYFNKTYVSWNGDTPTFVANLITAQGPYDEAGFQAFLNSHEWLLIV